MARRMPDAGNVSAMKADSEFLGAEDILGRGDVRIRIVRVITYPKGYTIGGRPSANAFPALEYERRKNDGSWVLGRKRWAFTSTEVRQSLIIRARSNHATDWRGMEVDIHCVVCRSCSGGWTWGIRVRPTPEERNPKRLAELMQEAADRLPPDQRDIKPDNDVAGDVDYDEPPEDWEPSVAKEETDADADLGG